MSDFGKKLKKFRLETGQNQIEFCEKISYSQTHLSNVENGKVPPTNQFMAGLKRGFDVDISDFLKGTEYENQTLKDESHGVFEDSSGTYNIGKREVSETTGKNILLDTLIEQLAVKDKQIAELHTIINNLTKNSQ